MCEMPSVATSPIADGPVHRALKWLRAGYPEGVPPQDYLALLGILRRSMTGSELDQVVDALAGDAEAGQQLMTRPLVEQRIAQVVRGPIDDGDVARVSARLAAAGWPLGSPHNPAPDLDGSGPVGRVVDWLRAGYPAGVPDQDFVPLLALLRRRLSDTEVIAVADRLAHDGAVAADRIDIGSAIARVTSELPSEVDIERVRAHLEAGSTTTDA
jgi:hypothetical protein